MRSLRPMLTAAVLGLFSVSTSAALINEVQPNPVGSDPSMIQVELLGEAGTSFSGVLLSIESDAGSGLGTIDRLSMITGTFDANGLLTVSIDDLENPSFTLVLADSFSGSTGDDIDVDNDGVADDLTAFGTILDAIGSPDNVGDESTLYGAQLGGLDFSYSGDEPQLIFRDSQSLDWYAINDPAGTQAFDLMGNAVDFADFDMDPSVTTFGAINPTATVVPVPGAIWLFVSGLGLLGLRRR